MTHAGLITQNWQEKKERSKEKKEVKEINIITIDNCLGNKLSRDRVSECDALLTEFKDLICGEYKAWYCKMFYQLGSDRFYRLAKSAQLGKSPARLFSYLLKQEIVHA